VSRRLGKEQKGDRVVIAVRNRAAWTKLREFLKTTGWTLSETVETAVVEYINRTMGTKFYTSQMNRIAFDEEWRGLLNEIGKHKFH